MTSVVFINPGHDTAGSGYAFKRAFEAESDWTARAICRNETYLQYPTDIVWDGRELGQEFMVKKLVARADVVHALNSPSALGWFRLRPRQVIVVHHLGSTFRRDPEAISAICREYGATEVTDSIDLLFDGIGWLPIPADLDALEQVRKNALHSNGHPDPHGQVRSTQRQAFAKDHSRVRIAHAPTDREYKDTEAVIKAVESLARKYPIDFDLIERQPNAACLQRKAKADIFVDQLRYGFGLNAIECWAMGIPVVSGLTDEVAKLRGLEMWGRLPWADATAGTLEAVIEHLILDEEWRTELGVRGRVHAEVWHSQRAVVERAMAIYERARQQVAA